MKKIVFMNPLALFFICFVLGTLATLLTIPVGANSTNLIALAVACVGFVLSMVFTFFWPYVVYKYLARQNDNAKLYAPNQFDKPVLIVLFLIPACLLVEVTLKDSQIYTNYNFLFEALGALTVLFVFATLGLLLWSTAKMLKGSIGWCLVLLYWPLLAVFVQNEIKELYPETSV